MSNDIPNDPANFNLALSPGSSIKAAMKAASATSRDNWQVPIDKIHVLLGLNPRTENDEFLAGI